MAYHPMRQRDPLLETDMRQALERRGRELLGLALVGLGVVVALMLGSYVPEDPSWMAATDEPVRNVMGRLGASVASAFFVTIGWAAWGLVVLCIGWGLRFVLNTGADRVFSRVIFAPIAIAVASVHASTLLPYDSWNHSFGLGGLFGDTVLGAVLSTMPERAATALRVISAISGLGLVATGLFVLGATMPELSRAWRFLLTGLVLSYARLVAVLGWLAAVALPRLAALLRQALAERRSRQADQDPAATATAATAIRRGEGPSIRRAAPEAAAAFAPLRVAEREPVAPPEAPRRAIAGILPRLPRLRPAPSVPEPELVDAEMSGLDAIDPPAEDRIRAKIMTAIRSRTRPPMELPRDTRAQRAGTDPDDGTAVLPRSVTATALPVLTRAPLAGLRGLAAGRPPETAAEDAPAPEPEVLPVVVPEPETRHIVQHPRSAATSRRAAAEAQPAFDFEAAAARAYEAPPLGLLARPTEVAVHRLGDEALEANARMLETVLDDYGVRGEIVSVRPGPVVTMYELEPAPGLKASRVIGLADDIARSMSALSARVSTVPGRSVIGIELPNVHREKVLLREILSARAFGDTTMKLPLALGKDISGMPVVTSLAKMPHLLIAGTTGSGKSVAINTMILSLLYKLSPEECRLIMIDPKMLELSVYDGIPHLLSPVVTDPKKAVVALKWVVGEMEDRYRKMSRMGVRNIEGYNGRVRDALDKGEMFVRTVQTGFDDDTGEPVFETQEFQPETLPFIVVIVDEMADLMMVAGKEIEACIQRLAQMARASGIHLIMATQRPSVDVITGTIKANFPTRISFQVTSKIDSRTILGEQGAEQLLGQGDMLYMAGGGRIQRVHGPFVSDEEVEEVVNHLKSFGPPEYRSGVTDGPDEDRESNIDAVLGLGGNTDGDDALYDQAVAIVARDRKCSTSYIQRKLAIGYNKAARLVEQMEEQGVVSAANHVGKREVLVPEA